MNIATTPLWEVITFGCVFPPVLWGIGFALGGLIRIFR